MEGSKRRIGRTVMEDLRRGDFKRTIRNDYRELKEYFLTEDRKARLTRMGRLKRWFFLSWWLFEALVLKLTPARRILLLIGVLLILLPTFRMSSGHFAVSTGDGDYSFLAFLLILFVLMLELKDKLLAKDELESGRAIQRALLPQRSPQIPGWEAWLYTHPAREVGGDLVDFLPLDQGRYGVSLGDVSGKGLGAALFMARVQAVLRALAPDYSSLASLATRLNLIFYRDSLPNRFASLVYLEITAHSGKIRLVNMGHMPPLLLRNGRPLIELPKGGAALGLGPETHYAEEQLELHPGDIFIVYSDGVTEARNGSGEFFGEKRLFQLLSAASRNDAATVGEMIIQAVERFVGDAKRADDLSLIVLKRR